MAPRCPKSGSNGRPVESRLVRLQVRRPWEVDEEGLSEAQYFCPTEGCEIVYFAESGRVITVAEVRRPPAYKTKNDSDLLCYCFNVTGRDVGEKAVAFIRTQVGAAACACDVLNPSGDCCLGSIAKWQAELRKSS